MRVEDAIVGVLVVSALLIVDSWLLDRHLRNNHPAVREKIGSPFDARLNRRFFQRMAAWWRFIFVEQFELSDTYLSLLASLQAVLGILVYVLMALAVWLAPASTA